MGVPTSFKDRFTGARGGQSPSDGHKCRGVLAHFTVRWGMDDEQDMSWPWLPVQASEILGSLKHCIGENRQVPSFLNFIAEGGYYHAVNLYLDALYEEFGPEIDDEGDGSLYGLPWSPRQRIQVQHALVVLTSFSRFLNSDENALYNKMVAWSLGWLSINGFWQCVEGFLDYALAQGHVGRDRFSMNSDCESP